MERPGQSLSLIHIFTGFVGPSSKPIPLTDEEVDKLGVDVREVSLDYAVDVYKRQT